MHTHMHRIQLNAYLICTMYIATLDVHIPVSACIWLYLHVSWLIGAVSSAYVHVCRTHTCLHTCRYVHMHCLKTIHMCMYFCHEYMHMRIFESSAYLYVSDCIWLYFTVHICMYLYVSDCILLSHTFTYASKLWFLLPLIGRPQQRDARESVKISNSYYRSRTSSTSASKGTPQQRVHHSVTYRIVLLQTQSCLHWMLCQCSVVLLRLVGLVVLNPLPGKLERMFFDCRRICWEFSLNFSSVTLPRVPPIDCRIDRDKSSYTNVLRNIIQ